MRQLHLIPVLVLFILTGCKKDPVPAPTYAILNIAPRAIAGADIYVLLPADSVTLNGKAIEIPSDIAGHNWKKISGPSSFVIEKPGLLQTKVRNLVTGTYEFELMVTDKGGLKAMDTVTVEVYDPRIAGSNEFIFRNLSWIFPWYSAIEVENIIGYTAPVKVFIQRDFDPTWKEASYVSDTSINNLYEYFIETRTGGSGFYNYGSLYIFYYGSSTDDTPQVKIQF